jgi:hypothetical protein
VTVLLLVEELYEKRVFPGEEQIVSTTFLELALTTAQVLAG